MKTQAKTCHHCLGPNDAEGKHCSSCAPIMAQHYREAAYSLRRDGLAVTPVNVACVLRARGVNPS